jgi:hypothetical protein
MDKFSCHACKVQLLSNRMQGFVLLHKDVSTYIAVLGINRFRHLCGIQTIGILELVGIFVLM